MSDNFPDYNEHTERSKKRRARNRCGSAQLLKDNEIMFEAKNNGAHLIVIPVPGEVPTPTNMPPAGSGAEVSSSGRSSCFRAPISPTT